MVDVTSVCHEIGNNLDTCQDFQNWYCSELNYRCCVTICIFPYTWSLKLVFFYALGDIRPLDLSQHPPRITWHYGYCQVSNTVMLSELSSGVPIRGQGERLTFCDPETSRDCYCPNHDPANGTSSRFCTHLSTENKTDCYMRYVSLYAG